MLHTKAPFKTNNDWSMPFRLEAIQNHEQTRFEKDTITDQQETKTRHSPSKPIIFPPPQINSMQIKRKEVKEDTFHHEEENVELHSERDVNDEQIHEEVTPFFEETYPSTIEQKEVEEESLEMENFSIDEKEICTESLKEDDSDHSFRQENILIDHRPPLKLATEKKIVKLPVLLANIDVEIDIFHSFTIPVLIDDFFHVDWKVHSLEVKTALPSTTIFLKGTLVASIDYVSKNNGQLHTINIPVEWNKQMSATWLSDPISSTIKQKEFMFEDEHGVTVHYEYEQQYAEPIYCTLHQLHFVSHQEHSSPLSIKGVAKINVHLLQQQYVPLQQRNSTF